MTFSEYAKLMHKYIFIEETNDDFLIKLIDMFMEDDPLQDKVNEQYNPMNDYEENTLNKIYSGHSSIGKKKVNKILAHVDEEKFTSTLKKYFDKTMSLSALEKLVEELKENKVDVKDDNKIEETCVFLLKEILTGISDEPKINKSKEREFDNQKNSALTSDNAQNTTAPSTQDIGINAITIPQECKICFCCKYWRGNRPSFLNLSFKTIKIEGKCMHDYESNVKEFTYKDSCDKFYPDTGTVSQYELYLNFPFLRYFH